MLLRMTDTVSLRRATEADISALDHLFQRSYLQLLVPDYPPSALVSAVPIMARAQPGLIRSGLFHVIEERGRLLGAGGWSLEAPGGRPGQRGVAHVRHLATDPDAVRRGVGRRLLTHILLEAKGSGMLQMRCQSTLTAVPFYSAMGFVPQAEQEILLNGAVPFRTVAMLAQL